MTRRCAVGHGEAKHGVAGEVELRGFCMMAAAKRNIHETIAGESHYTAQQLASLWHTSVRTIKRLFADEPGVLRISLPRRLGSSQSMRSTLRIPSSVASRMHDYLSAMAGREPPPPVPEPKKKDGRGRKPKPSLSDAALPSKEPEPAPVQSPDEQ
jgi:hypothetical protein